MTNRFVLVLRLPFHPLVWSPSIAILTQEGAVAQPRVGYVMTPPFSAILLEGGVFMFRRKGRIEGCSDSIASSSSWKMP